MKNMKFNLKTVIAFVMILIVLVLTFLYGGNAPGYKYTDKNKSSDIITKETEKKTVHKSSENTQELHMEETGTKNTNDISHGENISSDLEEISSQSSVHSETSDENPYADDQSDERSCYVSVVCDTIYSNLDYFNKEKLEILPQKGIILPSTKVEFYEGESVFSVTHRVLKKNKIHFEFTDNPMYSSVYVEGISNIYEFDCGDLSGWMYCVNGEFPNYGCSGYKVKPRDRIEWKYTCNLGEDVGNRFSNQR